MRIVAFDVELVPVLFPDCSWNVAVMMEIVKHTGQALWYGSETLRSNDELVFEAVKQDGKALRYAHWRFRDAYWPRFRPIVLEAMKTFGRDLVRIHIEYSDDREVVLAAVSNYGWSLRCVSQELRGDREVVLAAVRQWGKALRFATPHLQRDEEILRVAIASHEGAFEHPTEK